MNKQKEQNNRNRVKKNLKYVIEKKNGYLKHNKHKKNIGSIEHKNEIH